MSDFNTEDIKFNIKNRNFSLKKSDFEEDKKEQFLFEYFTKNNKFKLGKNDPKPVSLGMLDQEQGTEGTITQNDINIFLSDEKVKKKDISQQDLLKFIDKMFKLNPTKEEKAQNELASKFKNENGETLMTPELKEVFGLEYEDVKEKIYDEDGNVKKGMEIFDLNGDGKIDNIEKEYMLKTCVGGYSKLNDLKKHFEMLDSETENPDDGVITSADKQKIYDRVKLENLRKKQENLNNLKIKNENEDEVVTDSVKGLFTGDKSIATFSEIVDKNGNVKKGMEVFDLNGDGKLDDLEKGYFTSGGHSSTKHTEYIDISDLLSAINELDKVGYVQSAGGNAADSKITTQNKKTLHKILQGGVYMLDNMGNLPTELQQDFADVLKKKYLYDHKRKGSIGMHSGEVITIEADSISTPEVASILAHEMTHALLNGKMSSLQQEVVTFYMEYKLYSEAKKNDPNYDKQVDARPASGFKTVVVDKNYMKFVDNMRKENPQMSEKDIAVEAFLKFKFSEYNGRYQSEVSEDYIRNLDYSSAEVFFRR